MGNGRIASAQASPDGKLIVYQVGYYSVKQNKSRQVICIMDANGKNIRQLTTASASETDPAWIEGGKRIAFISGGQVWSMNADGTDRRQLTHDKTGIDGFKFSPSGTQVILVKQIAYHESIKKNPSDLPLASGRLITDLNYRHWTNTWRLSPTLSWLMSQRGHNRGTDILATNHTSVP